MNGVAVIFDVKVWLDTSTLFLVDDATLAFSFLFDSRLRDLFLLASGQ